MVQLTYAGEAEYNNTKGLLFSAVFSGNYGVNGVGDLLNFAPYELGANPTGILDPKAAYNNILAQPPSVIGRINDDLGGYYTQITKNAAPTLKNAGLRVFAPGGAELATNAAYAAAVTGGSSTLMVFIPLQ